MLMTPPAQSLCLHQPLLLLLQRRRLLLRPALVPRLRPAVGRQGAHRVGGQPEEVHSLPGLCHQWRRLARSGAPTPQSARTIGIQRLTRALAAAADPEPEHAGRRGGQRQGLALLCVPRPALLESGSQPRADTIHMRHQATIRASSAPMASRTAVWPTRGRTPAAAPARPRRSRRPRPTSSSAERAAAII
jgi:hypothetical protein